MRMANGHLSVCIPSPGSAQHLCQFTKTKCWSVCEGMNLAINTPHLHTPGVYLYISLLVVSSIFPFIFLLLSLVSGWQEQLSILLVFLEVSVLYCEYLLLFWKIPSSPTTSTNNCQFFLSSVDLRRTGS